MNRIGLIDVEGKEILDVTCGGRSIWFDKNHPLAVYCDKRDEEHCATFGATQKTRHIRVHPDVICDFTDLPFGDESFSLVVFDPPHIEGLGTNSWTRKAYGTLQQNWQQMLRDGFQECMRVLKPCGVLVFKWSETQIPTPEVIKAIGHQPLFGHHSGKKMNTNWLCFMKQKG